MYLAMLCQGVDRLQATVASHVAGFVRPFVRCSRVASDRYLRPSDAGQWRRGGKETGRTFVKDADFLDVGRRGLLPTVSGV